jgi:hypothetical protein
MQPYLRELSKDACILGYKQQLPTFCQTHLYGVITKKMSIFPSNDHENCREIWINLKPTQRNLPTLGVTCHLDYQRIKVGILVESLDNKCSATVGPTHDSDASVRLSLNECIQLHYFIDWISINDLL